MSTVQHLYTITRDPLGSNPACYVTSQNVSFIFFVVKSPKGET